MKTNSIMLNRILTTVRRLPALAAIALATGAAVGSLNASVIVGWNAKAANTTLSSATSSTNDTNLSGPVTLTLGPGFTPNSVGNTFGGYYTGDTSSGLASANSHGTYFEFTLTPASGYQVQITDLVVPTSYNPSQQYGLFTWQGSGSVACAINLASSSDSYGSSLGTVSPTGLGSDAGYWTLHLNSPLIISSAVTFRIEFSENFGWKTIGLQPDRSYWDPALLHNALEIDGSVTATGGGSQPATTTTTLGSSPNPSTVGQSVTFTATVQTNGVTVTGVTGNVIFKDGATAVYTNSSIASGVATYTTSGLTGGTHSFTAVYSGDANYATSTSAATNQTVNGAVSSGPAPITYSGLEGLTVGGINGQNDNPTQWFAAWSVQNNDNSNYTVQNTTPLTFGSLVTSSDGKYLNGGGGFLQMGRRLPTGYQSIWDANGSVSDPFTAGQIDQGTVWVSFLLRVNSSITSWDSAKIGLNSSATPYQFSGSTGLQIATVNGNSSWGIRLGDNGTASTLGSVSVGSTVFVVIKFELSTTAGANNAYVWMFSNSSAANLGGADLNTGTAMASITGKNTADLRFKAIGFYLDNAANRVDVDEIRFGTSYASVSPVPAATTTATTTSLGSSPNPSGYGQSVTFTATVQTNGTMATGVTGNVVFSSTNGAFSTNTVSSGSATSLSITNLPRGTNPITVAYSGDGNYLGSTNTLNQIVTNHPPEAGDATYYRAKGLSLKIVLTNLLAHVTDADGDTIALQSVGAGLTNATIMTDSTYVYYLPGTGAGSSNNDVISYTVSDGFGGTATANILVNVYSASGPSQMGLPTNGVVNITFYGIPNYPAVVQTTTNLSVQWWPLATNTFGSNGLMLFTDPNATNNQQYYRLSQP